MFKFEIHRQRSVSGRGGSMGSPKARFARLFPPTIANRRRERPVPATRHGFGANNLSQKYKNRFMTKERKNPQLNLRIGHKDKSAKD